MTDNRTTELRVKLTERGIEYATDDRMGVCETSWNGFTAMQLTPGAKLMMAFTPEQAIAATLGSEREAKLIRAMEDVLRHATDTVWAGEAETLVDRMVSLGVYGHDVYEGARPWEVD